MAYGGRRTIHIPPAVTDDPDAVCTGGYAVFERYRVATVREQQPGIYVL